MIHQMIAAMLAVSSQVTDVTVYGDRAQVTRTAEVQLEQGINLLEFKGLPDSMDSRSIQVNGTGQATVLDVRFKTENFETIPQEQWKALYDRQEELQRQQQAVEQKMIRLKDAKTFLKKISEKVTHTPETDEGEDQLNPERWESMLTLYMSKASEYDSALRDAAAEMKELNEALKKVQADIRDAGASQRKQRHLVEVDVEAPNAGSAVLKLSYIVHGPKWVPTYDIRVDTESRQLKVKYFALVRQNSGEDWGNVALRLSTASPGLGGEHPELDPWRIRMVDPARVSSLSKSISMPEISGFATAKNLYEADQESAVPWNRVAPEPAPMQERESSVTRSGASVLFEVKGQSEIASDNVEHRVAVSSITLPAEFRYSAIPKLDAHAYLKAKAVNKGAHPFLTGRANVFLDGSFVTATKLELISPDEEFWVFLGADESMKVEHKLIKKYKSREGLTGRTIRHTFEYLMTVKNTHNVAEEVIVWDQLPISETEGLEVKLLEPDYSKDTDSLKMDDEKRISWFRKLKPGEEWEIPLHFYVEAPKDMKITGLE